VFWAKSDLAQARWVRLGEDSQSAHCTTVSSLAQARMPSLGEIVDVAWAKAFSLSENNAKFHFFYFMFLLWLNIIVNMHVLLDLYEMKVACLD